jgi:hypothetical protein
MLAQKSDQQWEQRTQEELEEYFRAFNEVVTFTAKGNLSPTLVFVDGSHELVLTKPSTDVPQHLLLLRVDNTLKHLCLLVHV